MSDSDKIIWIDDGGPHKENGNRYVKATKRKSSTIEVKFDASGKGIVTKELPAVVTSCQVWVKFHSFIGKPKRQDFKLHREDIPPLKEGEILIEVICWNVEDYMRIFDVKNGSVMIGDVVGSVIATRNPDYPLFSVVTCSSGWRTHAVVNPETTLIRSTWNMNGLPLSLCLTTLGLPGLTAYFILEKICCPKPQDIVVVNAATGTVGNVVAQIARIKGCIVLAFTSSRERCSWLNDIGFDNVFDVSSISVTEALRKVIPAPMSADCFIDCVGADFSEQVVGKMNPNGSVCVCGYNSSYAKSTPNARKQDPYNIVYMQYGKVRTTSIMDFQDEFPQALQTLLNWVNMGRLKYKETHYSGFDALPDALAQLHDRSRIGNTLVTSELAHSLQATLVEY